MILAVCSVIQVFRNGLHFDLGMYFSSFETLVTDLMHPANLVFVAGAAETKYPVFPYYWDNYFYSMIIFFSAIIAAFVGALCFSFALSLVRQRSRAKVLSAVSFFESLPDILVIGMLQFVIIIIYKQTGWLVFNVVAGFHRAYAVPVFILAFLPFFFFSRIMLQSIEDENGKPYVELAQSKGLTRFRVISVHILRNALPKIMNQSTGVFWFMTSNLVILEAILNMRGVFDYLLQHPDYRLIALTLILFFLPVYFGKLAMNALISTFSR